MEIKRESEDRIHIEIEGEHLLGIATGVQPQGFGAQRVSALARRGGVFLSPESAHTWRVSRLLAHDGELYLVGPYHSGMTVREYLAGSLQPGTAHGAIPEWTRALAALLDAQFDTAGNPLQFCNVRTSLIDERGRLLLLDAELSAQINRNMAGETRSAVVEPFTREAIAGRAASEYTAAALLFHVLGGAAAEREAADSGPAGDTTSGDTTAGTAAFRNPHASVWLTRPDIRPPVAQWIDAALTHTRAPSSAEEVPAEVKMAIAEHDLTEDLDEAIRRERVEKARAQAGRVQRVDSARRFWRRRGTAIALAAAIGVMVLFIPARIVWSALQPPSTAGLSPEEVVSAFYEAWTSLDHVTMEDAVARGVAADRIREVTNLFVIDRVRTAQMMELPLMRADEWIAAGEPADRMPYGVVDLNQTVLRRDDSSVAVRVTYTIIRPVTADETPEQAVTASHVEDTLTLTRGREAWEISGIEARTIAVDELR